MRVLITGVSGFAGRWLARELARSSRDELYGLSRRPPRRGELPGRLRFFRCDLNDRAKLLRALSRIRPERIHHLAAQASVRQSKADPRRTAKDNVKGTRNLLAALHRLSLRPFFHLASSSEVYGRGRGRKLRESAPLRPENPYGASKRGQERLVRAWARERGARAVITRAFHHMGPGQKRGFVLSDWASRIARIEKGLDPPVLRVGDTSLVRDFLDVRDVARAYRLAAETAGGVCVYNVASGKGRKLAGLLRRLKALSKTRFSVRTDPEFVRKNEAPAVTGDPSKLRRATGWRPAIPIEKTLKDTLNYWRAQDSSLRSE